MAFIFNKFDESEEEFDAEQERYDMLRQKLFQGQSLKYDDLEELMTAAKEKDDEDVIRTLKNVVTEPEEQATNTVEPTPEDMMADLMESGKIDKESLDEDDSAVCDEIEENVTEEKLPESVVFNAVETLRRMY